MTKVFNNIKIKTNYFESGFTMENKNRFSRTEMLIGYKNLCLLRKKRVAVFGIGGVGGFAIEGLARSGIGEIDIIDSDNIDITNLNRQIISNESNIGFSKVDEAEKRIKEIDSEIKINKYKIFLDKETIKNFDFKKYDYIIDAIDTVSSKIELIIKAHNENIPVISSMGTGNKLSAELLEVTDIYKTSVCPLARVMRYELKKRGVKKLKVVYSKEEPIKPQTDITENSRHIPASMIFVPACAGMIIAGEVIKDLMRCNNA